MILDTYLYNLDLFSEDEIEHEEDSSVEDSSNENSLDEDIKVEETSAKTSKSDVNASKEVIDEQKDEELKFSFSNLIGKKVGMTQLFTDSGDVFPATVVQAGPCTVTQIKNKKNDGYDSVQLGFIDAKEKHLTKPLMGHFAKSKIAPKKVLKEFRLDKIDNIPSIGDEVNLKQFNVGDFLTITGKSIGKGFAGHMKRHNFGGGRASHGKNSVMRKSGSVGAGTDPGRIFPGMKMAGRMGDEKVTVKNLEVLNIDYSNNLIFIKGALPGSNNNYLYLTKK